MDMENVIFKDLERYACQYLKDGDMAVFEWEVAKLAFIFTTLSVVDEDQLAKIDRLTSKNKLSMMKHILEELQKRSSRNE